MVEIKVDLNRRENLRRLHTATHILNYSAREVLGNHVWQNGSNLKEEYGTLDITHYDNLSKEEIFLIERKVNGIIFENKKVKIEEIDRAEAEKKYGFILYQGGAIPMKTLRIVSVENSDIEACGGIHMLSTGGIGLLKIVDSSKIQDGVVRIKFVVRDFAFDFIEEKQKIISSVNRVFSVDDSSLISTSEKFFNEWKQQKKEIDNLNKTIKDLYVNLILNSNFSEYKLEGNFDMGFMIELFNRVTSKINKFKLVSDKFVILSSDLDVVDCKKVINRGKFKVCIL